jgi:hypothetical protein
MSNNIDVNQDQILTELKKLNSRVEKLEELHRLIHDLLIEYITIKTIKVPSVLEFEDKKEKKKLLNNDVLNYNTSSSSKIDTNTNDNTNNTSSSSSSSSKVEIDNIVKKNILKKKNYLNNDDIKFKTNHEEVENNYYLKFNSKNYAYIEEKLSDNSSNNKVNVYKFLFVHFDDMRYKILKKLECEDFLINMYNNNINQKKIKDITELLKNECIEIHKTYKDKEIFKKLLIDLKKEYDDILSKVA